MTNYEVEQLIVSFSENDGIGLAQLTIVLKSEDSSSQQFRTVVIKQVHGGDTHKALLELAESNIKEKISPVELFFHNVRVNVEFLEKLKNSYIFWEEGSIKQLIFHDGELNLSQAEFEDMICPLRLDSFSCSTRLPSWLQINDKIVSSVKDCFNLSSRGDFPDGTLLCPRTTDKLLRHWMKVPPKYVTIGVCCPKTKIRTGFTMKTLMELMKLAFTKKWNVCWNFGQIEVHDVDHRFTRKLEKLNGVTIVCNNQSYMVRGYDTLEAVEVAKKYCRIHFECVFVQRPEGEEVYKAE